MASKRLRIRFGKDYVAYSTQGVFSISGSDAALSKGTSRSLSAQAGACAVQGSDALMFTSSRYVPAETGAFLQVGRVASLLKSTRLQAAQGSVTHTGSVAALLRAPKLVSAQGAFALAGVAAALPRGKKLTAAAATFALNGVAALFARTRRLASAKGTFTFTGINAGLTYAGSDDWASRSAGAILADRLNTTTKIATPTATISATQWLLNNGTADHVSLDTSLFPPGSSGGSYKFNVLNADGTASGDVGVYFGNITSFGEGAEVWYSYRIYAPPEMAYSPWPFSGGGGSHKLSIFSRHTASNQPNEVVVQTNYTCNQINGYWQDGITSSVLTDVGYSSAVNSSDIRRQPSVDRGASPLTGNNPDTGSAWSTYEQQRARYGLLYSAQSQSEFKRGYGDPFSGGVRQNPNEWITITARLIIGTWDTNTSRWTLWAARQSAAPILIHDATGIRLGSGPDYNCLWLTPYCSDRSSGGRSVTGRTNNITGLTIHGVAGLSTPVGTGTVEYNASTGRVRWQGSGESFGTARGFSSANNILTRNVASSAADSYLIVTADPALLPSSGTVTDTVTISNGRPNTQVNYADAIISASGAIKSPGGHIPPGLSALEQASAGMTTGQWLNFSASSGTTGLLNFSNPVSASNSGLRTAYSSRFVHDIVDRKAYYYGGDHAEDGRFLIYNEDTNAWTLDHSPAFANIGGAATARHSYDHNVWVPTLRKFFTRTMQTLYLQRWDGGTTWTQRNYSTPTYPSSAIGMEWFPELGKIMLFQDESGTRGALVGLDPSTGAATTYVSAASGLLDPVGDPHNFCEYSPLGGGCIFFGGGNSVNTAWVFNSSLQLNAVTLPAPLLDVGPGSSPTLVTRDPVSGKFLLIRTASLWYEFDPVTRVFTAKGGSASVLSANTFYTDSAFGLIACPMPQRKGIAFLKSYVRGVAAEMWFLKC